MAILFLLQALGMPRYGFNKQYNIIIVLVFVGFIFGYYLFGKDKRYYRIITKFENKGKKYNTFFSILVVVGHYVLSFLLVLVAGLYMNKDWIFAN